MSITSRLAAKTAPAASAESTIQTGMQGSVASAVVGQDHLTEEEAEALAKAQADAAAKQAKAEEELLKEYPEGSYKMLRQRALILNSGARIKPDANGILVPKSDEEKDLLAYFEAQDLGLVKKIK